MVSSPAIIPHASVTRFLEDVAFMGSRSHALYSRLDSDLSRVLTKQAMTRVKAGEEWPGMSFTERAALSIRTSLLKKEESGLNEVTKAKALDKFLQINSKCESWRLVGDEESRFGDDFLLGEVRDLIYWFWNRVVPNSYPCPLVDHPYDLLAKGKVGPGSAIGSRGGDFYTKLFSSKMSTTDLGLYRTYKRYVHGFPEWANAEETRFANFGLPDVVKGNRLDFVPKNDDISRSICVEPSLNMFYQLGFEAVLNERLKDHWGIDLTYQQFKNRELARKGSTDLWSFSTIDLSSASDSISLKMLKWLLPPDFYSLLVKLRSPMAELPDGRFAELHMISTMGNGYTFPLQTIIFSAVVLACFRMDGLAPIFPYGTREGNFGVNGDDIVIPSCITQKVLRLLHLLGFTPNDSKTFVEGPFRESCGGDYYNGRNLRGVYIKKLNGPQDYYSVINQLNLFSTRTGILLPRLVQHLLAKVKFLPVPIWENDSSGIKLPYSVAKRHCRVCRDTQSTLYFALTPLPPPLLRLGDMVIKTPYGYKSRIYNPSGLLTAILQGSVNPDGISLIPKETRYRTKPRVACNWDTPLQSDIRTVQLFQGWFVFGRWESVAYLNLFS